MADDHTIDVEVKIDGAAYDDPMDALEHVNDLLNESDDVNRVNSTLREDSAD